MQDFRSLKRDCFALLLKRFVWQRKLMEWLYTGLSHVQVAGADLAKFAYISLTTTDDKMKNKTNPVLKIIPKQFPV